MVVAEDLLMNGTSLTSFLPSELPIKNFVYETVAFGTGICVNVII
jgi:hypothetical protein